MWSSRSGPSLKLELTPHTHSGSWFSVQQTLLWSINDSNSCRQTKIWQKPCHCPGVQLPSNAQPENRLQALLPTHHSSRHLASLRFHTGGWGAPSCSGVMKWFFRSVVCFIRWEANLCPWSNLSRNQGEQWALFVLNLILIFDIMQFLNNSVWAAQYLLMCKSSLRLLIQCSDDCCQRWYWKC